MDDINFTIGDVFGSHTTLVWEDTEDATTYLHREGDTIRIERRWKNVRAVLERNAREAAAFSKTDKLGDFVKLGTIPTGLFWQWQREGITDDPDALARRMNDPDYAKLRVNNLKI